MLRILIAMGVCGLSGCTMAGPYVSNISSDGRGKLIIEKCMVEANALMGTVSNKNCTTSEMVIMHREDRED